MRLAIIYLFCLLVVASGYGKDRLELTAIDPSVHSNMHGAQSWRVLDSYDSKALQTPVIDRLTSGGVIFRNAYVAVTLCPPSRSAGEMVSEQKEWGQNENILIIYSLDNGMTFPRKKTTLYHPGVKVSQIINWEDMVKAGRSANNPVNLIDGTPTLMELTDISVPKRKFVVSAVGKITCEQQYNTRKDPDIMDNLAGDSEYRPFKNELKSSFGHFHENPNDSRLLEPLHGSTIKKS